MKNYLTLLILNKPLKWNSTELMFNVKTLVSHLTLAFSRPVSKKKQKTKNTPSFKWPLEAEIHLTKWTLYSRGQNNEIIFLERCPNVSKLVLCSNNFFLIFESPAFPKQFWFLHMRSLYWLRADLHNLFAFDFWFWEGKSQLRVAVMSSVLKIILEQEKRKAFSAFWT